MEIGSGEFRYQWIEDWANIPDTPSRREGWSHHAMVVTSAGEIVGAHPGEPRVLFFDPDGTLKRSWEVDLREIHGLTRVQENGTEYLWIVDTGSKRYKSLGYNARPETDQAGQVVKVSLDGSLVQRLETPPLPIYDEVRYSPTGMTVFEERVGGNGDLWVTDGYGASWVHRYDKNGAYLGKITGEEGSAGHFSCPHSVFVDIRRDARLVVADRANARFQIYDLEGGFQKAFGSDFLTTPSAVATHGDVLIVAELRARIALLDGNDELIGYLGDNRPVCDASGWPNRTDRESAIVPTDRLVVGKFNSPHGMTVDQAGNLYVSEWLIGGRYIKLAKC